MHAVQHAVAHDSEVTLCPVKYILQPLVAIWQGVFGSPTKSDLLMCIFQCAGEVGQGPLYCCSMLWTHGILITHEQRMRFGVTVLSGEMV